MTKKKVNWPQRLDRWAVWCGALVPAGLVVGNVGFEALIALTALIWIARGVAARENPLPFLIRHPTALPWIAWYLVMVVSVVVNGPGSKGWAHDVVFVRYPLFGLALMDISRRQPVGRYLVRGLAFGVLWAAVNTLAAYAFGFDLLGKPLARYTGKLKEASRIAGMAGYAAPFFLAWAVLDTELEKKKRTALIALGCAALALVIQTRVRTALLAVMAAGFFSAGVLVVRRRAYAVAGGLCGALVLILGLWYLFSNNAQLSFGSIYDRVYYWKVAWAMWLDHPLLGVGISSFQDAYKEMAASGRVDPFISPDGTVWQYPEVMHAHNLFFMVLSCNGVVGLAAFIWLFVNATMGIFRHMKGWGSGLVVWPVVLLVFGLTGFNIYHSWYQALLAFLLVLIGVRFVGKFPAYGNGRMGANG